MLGRDRPHVHRPLAPILDDPLDVPGKLGLNFDLTDAQIRDLRLPARDHDGAATRGPAPRAQAQARADRGIGTDESLFEARA